MSLKEKYDRAKHKYHILGKRAAGKDQGSTEHREYEAAKREYHRLGEELRRAKRG
jgi:hypothetical protein